MKKLLRLGLVSVLVAPLAAQVVITSFDQDGKLAWANSATNAEYRVEWAGSPTGPWRTFDALTNLSSIAATSNHVTVQVPTFYRVAWVDAPDFAGNWDFSGFDEQSKLVVTGRLALAASEPIGGTWNFKRVSLPSGGQTGELSGSFTAPELMLILPVGVGSDASYQLDGKLTGNSYTGQWSYNSIIWSPIGKFSAERVVSSH